MLNSRAAIVLYVELLSLLAAMAVPKYRPDCAAAAPSVLSAASADGIITATAATVATLAAPATSALTITAFFRRIPPRWTEGLVATLASFSGERPAPTWRGDRASSAQ